MKFIYLRAGEKAKVVDFNGKVIDYEMLKEYLPFTLTVATRKIGKKYFDIWLDDEGLLKPDEKRIITGCLVKEGKELLVGDLIICKSDKMGNSIGLTDEEVFSILYQLRDIDEDITIDGCWDGGCCTAKAHSNIVAYEL